MNEQKENRSHTMCIHAAATGCAEDYLVAADALEEAGLTQHGQVYRRIADLLEQGKAHDSALRDARCAYCGQATTGSFSIDRDGFCEGPEVALCDACGSEETPTEREIWARIGQRQDCIECETEIRSGDERRGSFHAWCVR